MRDGERENSTTASPLCVRQPGLTPLTSLSSPLLKGPFSITATSHRLPQHFPIPLTLTRHQPAATFSPPLTCHLPSPSPSPEAPAMLPPPSLLQPWSKLQGRCQPPLSIVSLLPLAAKPLSPFPSLAHAPGSVWPTLSSPVPSPQKGGTWCFPASLEPSDASPLLPAQAHPLLPAPPMVRGSQPGGLQQRTGLGQRGGGHGGHRWGPVLHPSTHTAAALPTQRSWRSRDGRRRISGTGPGGKEVREGIHGGRCPGGPMPRRGTEADTRNRRPGWHRT